VLAQDAARGSPSASGSCKRAPAPRLQVLALDDNSISDVGAWALAPSLAGLAELEEVSLCYNAVSEEGAHAVKRQLTRPAGAPAGDSPRSATASSRSGARLGGGRGLQHSGCGCDRSCCGPCKGRLCTGSTPLICGCACDRSCCGPCKGSTPLICGSVARRRNARVHRRRRVGVLFSAQALLHAAPAGALAPEASAAAAAAAAPAAASAVSAAGSSAVA
jgi:hypothetical protein